MITFSKNSWHYRLYLKMYGKHSSVPTSICPYFWKVVWAILFEFLIKWILVGFFIVGAVIVSLGILTFPSIFTSLLTGELSANTLWGLPPYHWVVILFDIISWGVTITLWFIFTPNKSEKEPSLIIEWIKAKKQKICPTIKFEEEE